MRVVTAGSGNYAFADTIRYNEANCKKYGYDFKVYDLGGLGFGTKVDDPRVQSKFRRVKSAMKPELLREAIATYDGPVAWIDGDATLIKPIDEVFNAEPWDVGITVRPKRTNKKTTYINAGVFFARQSGLGFVEEWIDAMPPVPDLDALTKPPNYSDQQTLENEILLPEIKEPLWDLTWETRMVRGYKVKFFPCEIYNNFWCIRSPHYELGPGKTKVIHFKGHRMHRLGDYHERFLR
jgi:hypothetical protein